MTVDLIIARSTGEHDHVHVHDRPPSLLISTRHRQRLLAWRVSAGASVTAARVPRDLGVTCEAGPVRQADRFVRGDHQVQLVARAMAQRQRIGARHGRAAERTVRGALDAVEAQLLAAMHVDVQQPRRAATIILGLAPSSFVAMRTSAACMPPPTAQPLAIKAAATAEATAPAKKRRLIENMLALLVSLKWFVVPFTTDLISKGRANARTCVICLCFY